MRAQAEAVRRHEGHAQFRKPLFSEIRTAAYGGAREAHDYSPDCPDGASRPVRACANATHPERRRGSRAPCRATRNRIDGRELDRRRAHVVHRHDRDFHQQLVLDQRMQVEIAARDQQVFLGVLVLGRRGLLIGHETEPAVDLHRRVDRRQAALADQRHGGLGCQVQPGLSRPSAPTRCSPSASQCTTASGEPRPPSRRPAGCSCAPDRRRTGWPPRRQNRRHRAGRGKFSLHPLQSSAPTPAFPSGRLRRGCSASFTIAACNAP